MRAEAKMFPDRMLAAIICTAVLLGCALRLAWPLEIEYKADEQYMFERSQRVGVSEPWPALGMRSGAGGLLNPGLSVWFFVGLARASGATTPVGLARAVQVLNGLALVVLLGGAWRCAGEGRRTWLWAAGLAALSPTAILVQRKIWAQSVLPLLGVLMLAAWGRRKTFAGAFAWAALAVAAGQIHMTGFIFFAALSLWSVLFRRGEMNWRGWTAGAALAGVAALPWVRAVLLNPQPAGTRPALLHGFTGEFWRLWATDGVGVGLPYNLGRDWSDFMRFPLWHGQATWLVGAAELVLVALPFFFLSQHAGAWWRGRSDWRAGLKATLGAGSSETGFLFAAALVSYGVLLSLPDFVMARHYLLITFPLAYVWLAAVALSPVARWRGLNEKLLLAALALNLFVAGQLFGFLRQNGGAPHGDFGVSWREQQKPAEAR
jgi:hypothetical protein